MRTAHRTAASTRARSQPDRYLKLIREFPLRPVRTAAECARAFRVIDRLAVRDDLDVGEADYLAVLTTLVEQYESGQTPLPPASGPAVLKHLMEARGMTTADLGRLLGHSSLASAILSGKRQISKTHALTLAAHFKLDAGVFLAS